MDSRPFDADNHCYETLDSFTRHLDPAFTDRGVKPVQDGKRVKVSRSSVQPPVSQVSPVKR